MPQVQIVSDLCFTSKEVQPQWSWEQLCNKLYDYTGISPQDMQLEIESNDGSKHLIKSPVKCEGIISDTDYSFKTISVIDTNENSIANQLREDMNNGSDAEFKLSEKAYQQRTDSVLNWKKENKLGKFDPAYASKLDQLRALQEEHSSKLAVDERCSVKTADQPERRGWLRFVGVVPQLNETDIWCGIEFDEPVGKSNGSFRGSSYFGPVRPNYGGFVRPSSVETGKQFTPLLDDELLSSDEDEL